MAVSKHETVQSTIEAFDAKASAEDLLESVDATASAGEKAFVLQVEDLSLRPLGREGTLVERLSFSIRRGEILGLLGESGCGKSVTALALTGLLPNNIRVVTGRMKLFCQGYELKRARTIRQNLGHGLGIVFQDALSALNPLMKIGAQLDEALRLRGNRLAKKERRTRIIKTLDELGLTPSEKLLACYPHELSGGMRQRVLLALSLMQNPELLVVDEVTTALDVSVQRELISTLRRLNRERGLSILMITHDVRLAHELCDRILVLYAGERLEEGETKALLEEPWHPYTQLLIQAMPSLHKRHQRLERVRGAVPTLMDIEQNRLRQGCIFATRCPLAKERCWQEKPEALECGHHWVRCHYAEPNKVQRNVLEGAMDL